MDFKETKACSLIKEFILQVNNSVKNEKQIPFTNKDNILSKVKDVILTTPLSEHKGRFANPGMVDVIESIEKITENPYFRNSFGNKIRMDFGTGHELNFLCYLYCCFKKEEQKHNGIGIGNQLKNTDNQISLQNINTDESKQKLEDSCSDISVTNINQVSGILREYFEVIRLFIKKFNIEAAGSRGCWSIDDYLLLPYLFGSAENFNDPRPIECVGTGMFREAYNTNCSLMLKDLCKLPWSSINVGMYKLYIEEVLGRHVVTQHFIYSEYLPVK